STCCASAGRCKRAHLAAPSPPARPDRALTARHVGVAPSIVNNNPETMERSRRLFPPAGGWGFTGLLRHGGMGGRGALRLRSIAARTARCFQRLGCAAMRLEA